MSARSITIAILTLFLFSPLAQAGPAVLYHAGVDDSWGRTHEDDGAVAHAPKSPLDGVTNKVVFPGSIPGDGSLFLDARVAQNIGDVNVYAAELAAPVTGRSDLVFPGRASAVAWYGEWRDDGDHVIEDLPDDGGDANDEFKWRGKASGDDVRMLLVVHPTMNSTVHVGVVGYCDCLPFYAFGDPATRSSGFYKDFSNQPEPYWYEDGSSRWARRPGLVDASLLSPMTHVTVADAIVDTGAPFGHDFKDAKALIDVDRYEVLSQDAANLYASTMASVQPTAFELRDLSDFHGDRIDAVVGDAFRGNVRADLFPVLMPPFPREPNTADDDFGGHARFGGVGDVAGSFNTYEGYQAAPHYMVDAFAVPDTEPVPGTRPGGHERNEGFVLALTVQVYAWHDLNMDGFLGAMCDTSDPQEWDAERNTCRNLADKTGWMKGDSSAGEFVASLCYDSTILKAKVSPVGGTWPGVIVVRGAPTFSDTDQVPRDVQVRAGDSEPIELEWNACDGGRARTRDIIVFPAGSPLVPIRTEVTATSTTWRDRNGLEYPVETVRDVDVYLASL